MIWSQAFVIVVNLIPFHSIDARLRSDGQQLLEFLRGTESDTSYMSLLMPNVFPARAGHALGENQSARQRIEAAAQHLVFGGDVLLGRNRINYTLKIRAPSLKMSSFIAVQ